MRDNPVDYAVRLVDAPENLQSVAHWQDALWQIYGNSMAVYSVF